MNIKFTFVVLLILALSFGFVAAQEVYHETVSVEPEWVVQNLFLIKPISPSDGAIFETIGTNNLDINFEFQIAVNPNNGQFNRNDYSWSLGVSGEGSSSSLEINWINDTYASAVGTFPTGDYQWSVTASQPINNESSLMTFTDPRYFSIREQAIVVSGSPVSPVAIAPTEISGTSASPANPSPFEGSNSGNNPSGGNGGNGGNGANPGRSNPRILPLEELSTSNSNEDTQNDESSQTSWITGAVIGLFGGERNAKVAGTLLIVLGIAGLLVYNREYLGLVKAK